MKTTEVKKFHPGSDFFSLHTLLAGAAEHKGLKLVSGASSAYTEPIKEYLLDKKILEFLDSRGIRHHPRQDDVFTLVDENPQESVPGWVDSSYWNFWPPRDGKGGEVRLGISIVAGLSVDMRKRGVVFSALSHGTGLSPVYRLPNFRMFKALVENDSDAPEVAKEIVASDGQLTVSWTELGIGGLRRLRDIFEEFAHGKEEILRLGRNRRVFDPVPYCEHEQPGDELFISEIVQPRLFKNWQTQLENYRSKLVA